MSTTIPAFHRCGGLGDHAGQRPATTTVGYYCTGTGQLVDGNGARNLRIGAAGIDAAVAEALLAALQPAALQACLAIAQQVKHGHNAALAQWRRQVQRARN